MFLYMFFFWFVTFITILSKLRLIFWLVTFDNILDGLRLIFWFVTSKTILAGFSLMVYSSSLFATRLEVDRYIQSWWNSYTLRYLNPLAVFGYFKYL